MENNPPKSVFFHFRFKFLAITNIAFLMYVILSGTAEFDQFMEFTAAWDLDFRQLGRGSLNASLSQAVGESWSFSKAQISTVLIRAD